MRTLKSIVLASSVVIGSTALGQDAVEWRVADGGNGHWYQMIIPTGSEISWPSARAEAEARGGYLATVASDAENNFVLSVSMAIEGWWSLTSTPSYCVGPWLGGFQPSDAPEPNGGWRWVTEEPWSWTHWWTPASEPNDGCGGEDYLHLLTQGGLTPSSWWNDGGGPACSPGPKSLVVEYSADCNNDGIVDYGQIRVGELDDLNANNIPDCCEQSTNCDSCAADVDRSGAVNGVDLAGVLNNWGTSGGKQPRSDIDGSGIVDAEDLTFLLNAWGPCP